jgi:hypothetical protein
MTNLPEHPVRDGQVLDANLHLLDRSIVDADDIPTSVVDDIEIDLETDGRPVISSLVLGTGIVSRFYGAHPPGHIRYRVPWRHVASVESAITLSVPRSEVDITWFETWLHEHVVGRIPGGRRDPE